jgi:UDP-N-acetylglucosamine 4,6-dehydratase
MKYVILGGTGTLGRALTRALLKDEATESITCFSRDELKQKELAAEIRDPRLNFVLGDIRNPYTLWQAMHRKDVVFHVAALKHIDTLEMNPEESVRTNILGTINVADEAIRAGVKHVVFSSTDKACAPINVYGMSKGISERILLHRNEVQSTTHFSVFRWGNVLNSRGSVIPFFVKTLKAEKKAYLTHPEMTRFWITIEDAVAFMLANYKTAQETMIPAIKGATVERVIDTTARILGYSEYQTHVVGIRPGEKLHESLLPGMSSDTWVQYSSEELESLVRPVVETCQ